MFEPFTERARAKVNLALHVLGRREDGYHELDSIVAFADIGDTLTFSPADAFSITASGPFASALPASGENIIAGAYVKVSGLAAAHGNSLPPVAVHLVKNLPVASGIGGGSANAAAAMRGFLKIAQTTALDNEIMAAALSLGADVPVCLHGKPCRMQGVGERITPLANFQPRHAILVNPRVEVSTPAVFEELALERGQNYAQPISDVVDRSGWRNDLTTAAVSLKPAIGDVISALETLSGNAGCFMSGSGATCVAIFESRHLAEAAREELAHQHLHWWVQAARLG
jgi:4-diphosphocytidyl-2-C-methyl-D-erythritol kinase